MSEEFFGGSNPEQDAMDNKQSGGTQEPGKIQTDVENIFADGMKDGLPVFDIEKEDFYKNMSPERKRIIFPPESVVAQYMQKTRYNKPFWVRDKTDGYVRKVK